jgi:hypothetical protein
MGKSKQFAWSYSALDSFELCPKKHYHEKIAKDVVQKTNEVQGYGIDGHKFFENRLLKGTPLPLDFQHHERYLKRIDTIPGTKMPEQKLAINRDYQPTGWFDDDVYCRAIIDFIIYADKYAVIVDWKFGKQKPGFDQLELSAAVFACFKPEIQTYKAFFYWAKEKKLSPITIERDDTVAIWNRFLPRVNDMQTAIEKENFPAKQNFLCKRHCPVKQCKYNGE